MTQAERLEYLTSELLAERPEYARLRMPADEPGQKKLLRSLMNVRMPGPVSREFLEVQDAYLREEIRRRGITEAGQLKPVRDGMCIWRGDITTLRCDAIVNAANSALLGCFVPCHGCIDNAIHSAAGMELREECAALMEAQGHPEPNGRAKLTSGYNLPARYVLHTVGPVIDGPVSARDREELAGCYRSCLELAAEHALESVAFCCISTGEFHFPNREAAEIAVEEVSRFLRRGTSIKKVIFNVFKDIDEEIYRELLGAD